MSRKDLFHAVHTTTEQQVIIRRFNQFTGVTKREIKRFLGAVSTTCATNPMTNVYQSIINVNHNEFWVCIFIITYIQ